MEEPTVQGVPIQCFVRVDSGSKRAGGSFDGQEVSVLGARVVVPGEHGDSLTFNVEHAYGLESTDQGVLDRSVAPTIERALLDGVCVCVLGVGSSSTRKTEALQSMIPLAIHELYDHVQSKARQKAQVAGEYRYHISASFCEVFNEEVQDLSRTENRKLEVVEDPLKGVHVRGLTVAGPFKEPDELAEFVRRGMEARNSSMTDFGPAATLSGFVLRINLLQVENGFQKLSALTFIDTPGSERLAEDPESVRMREGPSLSKGILAFGRACRALGAAKREMTVSAAAGGGGPPSDGSILAHLRESALTQLLADAIGGNCLTICMAHLVSNGSGNVAGQPAGWPHKENVATMQLVSDLQLADNFPLVNDDRALGLLRRYRSELARLREELAALQAAKSGNVNAQRNPDGLSEEDLLVKIGGLEGKIVHLNLDLLKVREEKERVFETLVEFRRKYQELVMAKANMQENMIKTEEDKLRISKTLMDLQIENSRLVSQSEADKYELVTKLLNAENDILEVESKEQDKVTNARVLQEQAAQLKADHRAMSSELVAVKGHTANVQDDLLNERSRTEQLSLEILSLVNQKGVVEKEFHEANAKNVDQESQLSKCETEIATLRTSLGAVETSLGNEQAAVEQLREAKVRGDIQLKQNELSYKEKKLQIEQNMTEFSRERDREVVTLKKGEEEESRRVHDNTQQLERQVAGLEKTTRQQHRKMLELERGLSSKMQDEIRLSGEVAKLDQQVKDETTRFRDKMSEYIASFGLESNEFHTAAAEGGKDRAGLSDPQRATKELLDDLVQSYKTREQELDSRMCKAEESSKSLQRYYNTLKERYTEVRNTLEDVSPDDAAELPQVEDVRAAVDAQGLDVADGDEAAATEVARVTQECANLRRQLDTEKERALLTGEHYARRIRELERQGGSGGGTAELGASAVNQLHQLQATLITKIDELKQGGGGNLGRGGEGERGREKERGSEGGSVDHLRHDVRRLQRQNAELQEQLERAGGAGTGREPVATPKLNMSQLEGVDPIKKAAQLMTHNTVLEQEMENYKKYMKATVEKSSKQAKKLKKQVHWWKDQARSAGVTTDCPV